MFLILFGEFCEPHSWGYRSPSLKSDAADMGSWSSQESFNSSTYDAKAFKLTIDESLHVRLQISLYNFTSEVDMKSVSEEIQVSFSTSTFYLFFFQEKVDNIRKTIKEIGLRYKNRLQKVKDTHRNNCQTIFKKAFWFFSKFELIPRTKSPILRNLKRY